MSDSHRIRNFYRRLLALYPKEFREQLGESMMQTFDDLCDERLGSYARGKGRFLVSLFADTAFGIVREHFHAIKRAHVMRSILNSPSRAAALSVILALVPAFIFVVAFFEIEPVNSFLSDLVTGPDGVRNSVVGLLILIGAFGFLPLAFFVGLTPIRWAMRAGGNLFDHPANLVLATVVLLAVSAILGHVIADQFPCWIGTPNCD